MFPWTIPDELADFVYAQFTRFSTQPPSEKSIDTIAGFVLEYVVKKNYYPKTPTEALARYHDPGLTEPEKQQLLPEPEYYLKLHLKQTISLEQLHLTAWAALLFAWSNEGSPYVHWYRSLETTVFSRQR